MQTKSAGYACVRHILINDSGCKLCNDCELARCGAGEIAHLCIVVRVRSMAVAHDASVAETTPHSSLVTFSAKQQNEG